MSIFDRIRASVADRRRQNHLDRQGRDKAGQVERGEFTDSATFANSQFHEDYDLASLIVKRRLQDRFPDNYHAKSLPGYDPAFNYSAKRNEAIDTSSAAIAAALRKGAGIATAVTAGSKSIGL